MKLPLKIYPSRLRAIIGSLVGVILFSVVVWKHQTVATEIGCHWYMYAVFYGLPALAIIAGLKGALLPKPQVVLYSDGFAYPKLGLKRLPWKDIRGTFLYEDTQIGRRRYFSPTESDRRLDLLIAPDSSALQQVYPIYRLALGQRDGCTVLPIGLMGAKTSTRELQKMIESLLEQHPQGESFSDPPQSST